MGSRREDNFNVLARRAIRHGCLICGKPSAIVGIYSADAETEAGAALGAPAGKTRLVFYALCEQHPPTRTENLLRVERLLEALVAMRKTL